MLIRISKIACLCFFLTFPVLAIAQEEEETEGIELKSGTVQRTTRVRLKPSDQQQVIGVLRTDARVRIISAEPQDGWIRVILEKGRQGYVRAVDVNIVEPSASMRAANSMLAARASPPCATALEDCEENGCAEATSTHGIFNAAKRRVPTDTTSQRLTFADFRTLQRDADEVVEQGSQLSQAERDLLRGFTVSSGTVGEGSLVKVVGFISRGADPHANTGESVNCRLRGLVNNDIHITLAPSPTNTEFKGIVIEMVPQDRPAGWTIAKLKAIKQQRRLVMVIGGLFYDNLHIVNQDASDPIPGEPKRFSIWEVHPVTRFFVCLRPNNACSPGTFSQWKRLEDFE